MAAMPATPLRENTVDNRLALIEEWLGEVLPARTFVLAPASADASFRRYFRVRYDNSALIVMDAPPDKEDNRPFVDIAAAPGDAGPGGLGAV